MTYLLKKYLLAVFLMFASVQANAVVYVLYDEDIGGDIDLNTFTLGSNLGEYSVSGTTSAGDGAGFDFDSFNFVVPTGTQVDLIGYSVFAIDSGIPYNFSTVDAQDRFGPGMDANDPGALGTWEIDVVQVLLDSGATSLTLSANYPLGAGTYAFDPYYWTTGAGYGGWRYAVTFRLVEAVAGPSPVPVPAAAWLFGSGLAALAGVARRRKHAA